MSYFVYILLCTDNSFYIGSTNNLKKRVAAHNAGKIGAKYTRSRLPVTLVYSEEYQTKTEALKREHELKQLPRKEKESLILAGGRI